MVAEKEEKEDEGKKRCCQYLIYFILLLQIIFSFEQGRHFTRLRFTTTAIKIQKLKLPSVL